LPSQNWKRKIPAELFTNVNNSSRRSTRVFGFFQNFFPVFTRLSEIDVNGVAFVALIHQPTKDYRSIQGLQKYPIHLNKPLRNLSFFSLLFYWFIEPIDELLV